MIKNILCSFKVVIVVALFSMGSSISVLAQDLEEAGATMDRLVAGGVDSIVKQIETARDANQSTFDLLEGCDAGAEILASIARGNMSVSEGKTSIVSAFYKDRTRGVIRIIRNSGKYEKELTQKIVQTVSLRNGVTHKDLLEVMEIANKHFN